MGDSYQEQRFGYQMYFSPFADSAASALLPIEHIACCRVLPRNTGAVHRSWAEVLMERLVCQGRFPLWALREGCFQEQHLLSGGTPKESCKADLGGWWASSLWWHWTDGLMWRRDVILKQLTKMDWQLGFSPVLSVHHPHAFFAACITEDYKYKHFVPIPGCYSPYSSP